MTIIRILDISLLKLFMKKHIQHSRISGLKIIILNLISIGFIKNDTMQNAYGVEIGLFSFRIFSGLRFAHIMQ